MGIHESEEELFAKWKQNRPRFVKDGAVDADAYRTSSPKLLFVLKEVNDPDGGDWDLRQFLRDGGRPRTWNNATRWVEGVRCLHQDDISWEKLKEIDKERRRHALRSIVVINLKKSPGGRTSVPDDLEKIAAEDEIFLKKQFSLYEPDIVICCGTNEIFYRHVLVLDHPPEWKSTHRGIEFHEFKPRKFVVSFSHPEARIAGNLLYYGLIDALREIIPAAT
jgi:hypothetical protein